MKNLRLLPLILFVLAIIGCARMGNPDGGWYDEKPPRVLATSPEDGAVNVSQKKITIYFDEYITIDNATENVVISPPQLEQAEIKTKGKSIVVELKDTLKENTTYTVDFSSAIKDNNESNVMGNYTYSFSTGGEIDTMEVSGYVIDAETLEPIQSIQVGLYAVGDSIEADTTIVNRFRTEPLLRVSRTDEEGHFTIKGVKPGKYRVYALMDMDNNFLLTPDGGEQMAFHDDVIETSMFEDIRQDTTWLDSLRIKSIARVKYNHYIPDNIILRAFTEESTFRTLLKSDRSEPDRLSFFFTYGDSILPQIHGLNFQFEDNYVLDASEKNDTLIYWLKDTALVNTDSLEIEITYRMTDTLGVLQNQTDTIMLMPKLSREKRLKLEKEEYEEWEKKENKKKKRGEPYDSIMPPKSLEMTSNLKNTLDPDKNITFIFKTPLSEIDSTKIHLYIKRDTLWFNARWMIQPKEKANILTYEILAEWQPGFEYSFELDSAAFIDIYGKGSPQAKTGFKVKDLDAYGTLQVNFPSLSGKNVIAQLMEAGEKIVKECKTTDGVARFFYLAEKDYYLRVIIDDNNNGKWDTGEFDSLMQPEQIYYYPKEISCRAKWDIVESWEPTQRPLNRQKPSKLAKSKSSKKKSSKKNRNAERAKDLGIELPDELK